MDAFELQRFKAKAYFTQNVANFDSYSILRIDFVTKFQEDLLIQLTHLLIFCQFSLKEIASYLYDGSGLYSVPSGFDGFAYLKFDDENTKDKKLVCLNILKFGL